MRAEQAIFTSAQNTKMRGYQLVGQSAGIDEEQALQLIRWCPSHAGLASSQADADSLNFHPVTDGWVALSRTMYGGPEYSARGGLQVVTRMLLLRHEHFAGYDYDPVFLAQVVLALGHLRLEINLSPRLPEIDLPNRPCRGPDHNDYDVSSALIQQMLLHWSNSGRVAVVGCTRPRDALSALFARLPDTQRLRVSFTTGLMPSLHRPYFLHFLASADPRLQQQLVAQSITVVPCQ